MRTRDEIIAHFGRFGTDGALLEVLLDIRDLLANVPPEPIVAQGSGGVVPKEDK